MHSASQNGEDLVARQGEETRRSILRTAAREFARNGYRQTRIADIIAELGITPQVLYCLLPDQARPVRRRATASLWTSR